MLNSEDQDGKIWSLPFQRSTPILYYNVEMLKDAGFDAPPKNNEELLAMAQALTKPDGSQWGLLVPFAGGFPIWMFQSFAIAYGQNIGTGDPTEVFLDNPQVLEALDFATKLGTEYKVGPVGGSAWGDTPTAFESGQAAMIYHTTGSLTSILKNCRFRSRRRLTCLPVRRARMARVTARRPAAATCTCSTRRTTRTRRSSLTRRGSGCSIWRRPKSSRTGARRPATSPRGRARGISIRSSRWRIEYPQYLVARDQLQYADREFATYRSVDTTNIINQTLSAVLSGSETDAAAAMASAQQQINSLLAEYK